jgi:uncharacterized protein YihD (DUF1040 family)
MRDPERIAVVLEHVARLWRLHPDWRLGQLIANVAAWTDSTRDLVWDIEDDVLVAEIQRHLGQQVSTAEASR